MALRMKKKLSKYKWLLALTLTIVNATEGKNPLLSTHLSPVEQESIQQQLHQFYVKGDSSVMNRRLPKFDVASDSVKTRASLLASIPSNNNSNEFLQNAAGIKITPDYLKSRCQWLKKRFHVSCDSATWSSIEPSDRVENLLETWVATDEVIYDLDKIPTEGNIRGDFWSGDYWRLNWGVTSYRYSSGKKDKTYHSSIKSYSQPDEWIDLEQELSLSKISKEILTWAPSEKYDLLVGDSSFQLTLEQKGEGANLVNSKGEVADWFGICDGWAPASVFVPSPVKPVKTSGFMGLKITWYPDDIRALASLAWTNGDYSYNLVGRRCDTKNPKQYKNGRISEVECADTNPATFHLALGNLIGKQGIPFIMDARFDAEVWNQPVLSYELNYFNPLYPRKRSKDWREVMVSYEDKFKKKDRFQRPLTRGYRVENKYFDGGVKSIVGVQATLVYLAEYEANFNLQPASNITERVTYTYDLELHEKNGELIPMGGEWHNNTHPDFLWTPQRDAVAMAKWDAETPEVDLSEIPSSELTSIAKKASKNAYPLCSVLENLIQSSSGKATYHCVK